MLKWASLLLLSLLEGMFFTACAPAEGLSPTPRPASTIAPVAAIATPTSLPVTATSTPTFTPSPTSTPSPTFTSSPTATPTPTLTPTSTPTPDPYAGLTIADLSTRSYGGGTLEIEEVMAVTSAFTRTLIHYPSEGLTLYGFMNVPQGTGPFPVALVMHGYIPPEQYNTLAYTTRYADALARAGYLVIHPNYRNYPPSDEGPDLFRVAQAVDALNLIAIIKAQAGQPGPLEKADSSFIGMLGHSMGGGITLRTITLSADVQAAVLYGAMSGDEKRNYEKIQEWSGGTRGLAESNAPPEALQRISPINFLDRITAAVSIHHGDNDGTVPPAWSEELCQQLQQLHKSVECFTYPGQPHTFHGESDQLFIQRVIDFFNRIREEKN
ncbi:MAG: prolyl oligopeptidase family serine peptidase [Anaerolineae bacterium]